MTENNTPAAPIKVSPWVTRWEQEDFIAAIAGGKVHKVTRVVYSDNTESGVANPNAKRSEVYTTACGTTRRGVRHYQIARSEEVTCVKCAKH